ncbi:MAG: tetratricopeptide repeat protein, partial [Nitrospirae bacterium]|nr:tetratricopeptide repeat protein [Nitrospirota bacterium]
VTGAANISLEDVWAPEWNNEEGIKEFKKNIEGNLSNIDLKEFIEMVLGENYEKLEETLEKISIAKYLKQFLLGYGEEGKMVQYVQLVDDTFLIRWPVPIARTGELGRRFREELKFAKNEVDRIFKNVIEIEPYRDIIPIWMEHSDDKSADKDSPRTAGKTIGGALILLFVPMASGGGGSNTWQLPAHEIKSLMETAKHELIHFYVNRKLGYYKSKRLPRDFHEGLATSLINESLKKVTEVKTEFIDPNSYVRSTKIIKAPEEYKRYHLQMKYLKVKYGNTPFYIFLKRALSGDDLDQSVKDVFGESSWKELFPSDISLWEVQKEIALNAAYIFISVVVGIMGLIILWRLGISAPRRYITGALLRRKNLISEMHTVVEKMSKSKMKKQFFLKPKNIIIIVFVILGALIFDLYRKWSLALDIDTPSNMFWTLIYFDSIIGVGIIISAMAIFPVNFLFLRRLEKESTELRNSITHLSTAESVVELNRTFDFNSVLLRLKKLESFFRFFPAFNRIVNSGNEIKSVLEKLVLEKIIHEINSLLEQGLFENAYKIYVNYRSKIKVSLSDVYQTELNKILESIVEYIFKRVALSIDTGQIDEAQEFCELMSLIIQKEGLEGEKERLLKLHFKILAKRALQEEFRVDNYENIMENLFNLALFLRDMGEHNSAVPLYHRLIEIYENVMGHGTAISSQVLSMVATCHNNLAFHTEVPAENWKEAEFHYRKAIELFNRIPDSIQTANSELNLQAMFYLSGQKVDLSRVEELTKILEEAGDKRAEKGYGLLKELS